MLAGKSSVFAANAVDDPQQLARQPHPDLCTMYAVLHAPARRDVQKTLWTKHRHHFFSLPKFANFFFENMLLL